MPSSEFSFSFFIEKFWSASRFALLYESESPKKIWMYIRKEKTQEKLPLQALYTYPNSEPFKLLCMRYFLTFMITFGGVSIARQIFPLRIIFIVMLTVLFAFFLNFFHFGSLILKPDLNLNEFQFHDQIEHTTSK